MWPALMAFRVASMSAKAVTMIRTVRGEILRTWFRKEMPSMPGMCKSDNTTAKGPCRCKISRPFCALSVVVRSKRSSARLSIISSRSRSSSTTNILLLYSISLMSRTATMMPLVDLSD